MANLTYAEQAAIIARQYATQPAVAAAPLDQAELFLSSVWSALPVDLNGSAVVGLTSDDSYLDRRSGETINTTTNEWLFADSRHDQLSEFIEWAKKKNTDPILLKKGKGSIFWNGASRRSSVFNRPDQGAKKRGNNSELSVVGALWADIDCALKDYPLEKAFEQVLKMVPQPTFILFSGGGLQVVHVLSEPWPLFNAELVLEYKLYSLAFYQPLFSLLDIAPDTKVHEAARMMRLPGFINRKPERGGARASILWHDSANRYGVGEIKALAAPRIAMPQAPIVSAAPRELLPMDSYSVSANFVAYIMRLTPIPAGQRHGILLGLCCDASRAGIPRDHFAVMLNEALKKTGRWYGAAEVEAEIEWAYDRITPFAVDTALFMGDTSDIPFIEAQAPAASEYLVKATFQPSVTPAPGTTQAVTPPTVTLALISDEDEIERQVKVRIQITDAPPPSLIKSYSLSELRAQLPRVIDSYMNTLTRRGSYLLLRVPPGVGKTHAVLQLAVGHGLKELARIAEANKGASEPDYEIKNGVLFTTLFKMDRSAGREWARQLGVDIDQHPYLFYFFEGRSADKNSAGYCAQLDIANAVAEKGRNVITSVCNFCPFLQACQEKHYLAQFKAAEKCAIVIARMQHLKQTEMHSKRKLVITDESPLSMVDAPIIIGLSDMHLRDLPASVLDQWPEEAAKVGALLATLREIFANLKAEEGLSKESKAAMIEQIGGRWFFDKLSAPLAQKILEDVLALPSEAIEAVSQIAVTGTPTLAALAALPQHFIPALVALLKHEYTFYQAGQTRWNSRLIPNGQKLQIHPMERIKFGKNAMMIVTDATAPNALYEKAFSDLSGSPRRQFLFEANLDARGRVTVFQGTENTKTTLLGDAAGLIARLELPQWFRRLRRRDYTLTDTIELAEKVGKAGNPALAQAMRLIHQLSDKHGGSLLVVLYKKLIEEGKDSDETFLRYWLRSSGVLLPERVQWFGNLRGKNDFKQLQAALVIGTPRLRERDLFIQAQIWYADDPRPIEFDRKVRSEPFRGYRDENGKGRAYLYSGYADDRLNAMFLHSIQGELMQCYERIRKNSSDEPKFVYLATAFPCADSVQEFITYQTASLNEIASQVLQDYWDTLQTPVAKLLPQQRLIERIAEAGGTSERTARNAYIKVRDQGADPRDGVAWKSKLEVYEGKNSADVLAEWLKAGPTRRDLSAKEAFRQLKAAGIEISESSVKRYWRLPDNDAIS